MVRSSCHAKGSYDMLSRTELLKLPDVTLVMVETQSHALAHLALDDCLSKVSFGDVLILTDKPVQFDRGTRVYVVPNWPSKMEWCRANWFIVPPLVRTSHILFCQWDAGIWDANMWSDEYFDYDYIGALWQWHSSKRVGNSGFSLKSTKLARYIYNHRDKYPCNTAIEDDLLCRTYRSDLENAGFTWAPERLAHQFSFEGAGSNPRPPLSSHFGFHGAFNFAKVFDMAGLKVRSELMAKDDYIKNSYLMQNFEQHPGSPAEEKEKTDA
jgi:hypothetical protein